MNGRKNGESWCIEDYTNRGSANTAPIGSRSFIGKCVNGEITIGQCADFNQEVCVSEKNDGLSEAVCMTNEWRSCISANEKDSYNAVERECKKYDQCVMFLDIKVYGKYGELAGFKKIANELQGAAGDVGKGANKVVPYCIPRYTPGMVFWNTENPTGSKYGTVSVSESGEVISEKKVSPGNQYGGSYEETKSICALASFTCATKYERWVTMWEKGTWLLKDNPECMKEEDPVKAQLFTEALNERCRALGPCGVYVNIAGELGNNGHGDKFKRTDIGADGDKSSKYDISRKLSSGYLNAIKTRAKFVKPGSMAELTGAVISYITGQPTAVEDTGDIVIEEAVSEIKTGQAEKSAEAQTYLAAGGAVGALALGLAPTATIAAARNIYEKKQ